MVKWCAIGHQERTKCDQWSGFSDGAIECETAENTEECIAKIMVRPSCVLECYSSNLAIFLFFFIGPKGVMSPTESALKI